MNTYDELYVVSDLHFGGERDEARNLNFQIFDQGAELAGLIRHVAARAGKVALVLNGDIVDFLAEKPARYLDPISAPVKLQRIFDDPSFSMIWDALSDFARTRDKELVLVLGNHDVELALPPVRLLLLARLCGDSVEARGRIHMALDGAGFACRVGDRSILCLHGNEADDWNPVDYFRLLQVTRALNRGNVPDTWDANAGTRMVVDVMNAIKGEFPFVDLLKPETSVVPRILLALKPGVKDDLVNLTSIMQVKRRDADRLRNNLLGVAAAGARASEPSISGEDELARLIERPDATPGAAADDVYAEMERRLATHGTRLDEERLAREGTLGWGSQILDRFLGRDPRDSLRESLREVLEHDKTFDVDYADEDFKRIDQLVGPTIDYVIAGHTHLERALISPRRRGGYFNTGTWIRLIRIPSPLLESREAFAPLYSAFRAGSMRALDEFIVGPGERLVRRIPTVAVLRRTPGGVQAALHHYEHGAATDPLPKFAEPKPAKE